MRNNEGKPTLRHIFQMPKAVEGLSAVLCKGEEEYTPTTERGWMKYDIDEVKDSLLRHLQALENGYAFDAKTGTPHTFSILFNAAVLVELEAAAERKIESPI